MNFSELKAELGSRGYDYLDSVRQGRFINDAMHELDEMYLWPYREASGVGTAPVSIPDMGTIEQVMDETRSVALQPMSFQMLSNTVGDVSLDGDPEYFYVAWPAGVPVVATYPTSTSTTIGIQYWRVASDLSANGDIPLSPARFHGIIVDIAVRMALNDSDNYSAAQSLQSEIDRKISRMATALLGGQQAQGPNDYQRVMLASEDW